MKLPSLKEAFAVSEFTDVDTKTNWTPLYYFNLYRLILAAALIALPLMNMELGEFVERDGDWFLRIAIFLAGTAIFNLIAIDQEWGGVRIQAHVQMSVDMLLIILLMWTSNGIDSGLGLLLMVTIAITATLFNVRVTLFYAATVVMLALAEHWLAVKSGHTTSSGFTKVGLLGIGVFAVAMLVNFLYHRSSKIQQMIAQRDVDLANLDQINKRIVERLNTGVIVTDSNDQLRSMNDKARSMLQSENIAMGQPLSRLSREMHKVLTQFRRMPGVALPEIELERSRTAVSATVLASGDGHMIFLEDVSANRKQARENKLAAIGRLATSIAHEIRNPLGAISHAGQLLHESTHLDQADHKLVDIVQVQSERINRIVEAILQFTRRKSAEPQTIQLLKWVQAFRNEFTQGAKLPMEAIHLSGSELVVLFDPAHLKQVLTNLCHNAVRHSPPYGGSPVIEIKLMGSLSTEHWIEVVDHGSGIPREHQEKLFEPFFTTHTSGTGLGLYISKELCEANGCRLEYVPTEFGTTFRVHFGE